MYKDKPPIEAFLAHVGVDHTESTPGSGRFRFGTGEEPYQHNLDFLGQIEKLRNDNPKYTDAEGKYGPKGKTYTGETAIAHILGYSTTQYRTYKTLAQNEKRMRDVNRAQKLRDSGYGYTEIARKMGLPNESSVRSLLNANAKYNMEQAKNTAKALKEKLEEVNKGTSGQMIDIGPGVERELGVSKNKLAAAVAILESEGYVNLMGRMENVTDPSGQHQITMNVLAPPGSPKNLVYNYNDIHTIENYRSRDNGETFEKAFVYPESMDSNRLMIRYAEDGGINKDGIIEIRRGVQDLSLGDSTYAQVRILVDNDRYLKGMAIYSDNLPKGVDVVFNTNKDKSVDKLDVLKKIKDDPDNPFGSNIKEDGGQYWYTDKKGERKLGLINKTREEGDWTQWQDKLPAQFLSKQPNKLVKQQLDIAIQEKRKEFNDIMDLENDTLKKYFLNSFATDCDSASVHLQAAALPRQKHQVILPIESMKDTEIYAPNFDNGERVALIRYPHGGTFEIPILTVNNKQKEASEVLKGNTKDCVGINSNVAARLSGADFDGDTVMVIPITSKSDIKSTRPLKGLEGFDPKTKYGTTMKLDANGKEHYYNASGKEVKIMKNTDNQMGQISNLITDMTIIGATDEEKARAVRHSMVVIDAEKHKLDYKSSYYENDIPSLKQKYQKQDNGHAGGVSTLISKAKSQVAVPKRQGQPKVNIKGTPQYDPKKPEGSLIFKTADENKLNYTQVKDPDTNKWVNAYVNKDGYLTYNKYSSDGKTKKAIVVTDEVIKDKQRTQKSTRMAETDDAYSLISKYNTKVEQYYADYANAMKSLANEARKTAYYTRDIQTNATAKETYKAEVKSLIDKLDISEKNAPREREAQRVAKARASAKIAASSEPMKTDQKKKLNDRELKAARQEVGAQRTPIEITDREWEAIQSGAVTANTLKRILNYTDKDALKERATPISKKAVSDSMASRIRSMAASGKTNSEIARALGLSASTVSSYVNQ